MMPSGNNLYHAFLETVRQYPQKIALDSPVENKKYTYHELLEAVQKQVETYQSIHQPVIISAPNSTQWVIRFLALLACHKIAVPIHYSLSEAEKQAIEQSFSSDFTLPTGLNNNVAAIFHTSGTTGKPKGIMLSPDNLLCDVEANIQVLQLTSQDTLVSMSPFSHVYGLVNVLLSSLLSGATLIVLPGFQPKRVLESIETHHVTVLIAVPTMYHAILSAFEKTPRVISSVRVCHSGAAPMSVALFHQLEKIFQAPVQEGYGLSEATSIVTSNPLEGTRKPGSIGLPIQNVQIKIDDNQQLLIKAPTVMLGYYQDTNTNSLSVQDNWLATGDLVTQDADGYLFWQGRVDDVINVAGEKVYPKEVEEVLYQHPNVALCAVKAIACPLRFQRVGAFIQLKTAVDDPELFKKMIQQLCRSQLASYKVPYCIELVDEIPTTPSGKIKRSLLFAP